MLGLATETDVNTFIVEWKKKLNKCKYGKFGLQQVESASLTLVYTCDK